LVTNCQFRREHAVPVEFTTGRNSNPDRSILMNSTWPTFWKWTLGLIAIDLAAWGMYHLPHGMEVGFGIVALTAMIISWRWPSWLAYLSLAELVVGGKGYLFSWSVGSYHLSIRAALFMVLLLRCLPLLKRHLTDLDWRVVRVWGMFTVWVAMMVVWGLVRGN